MSDFMNWFYQNYIKPQLDAVPKRDAAFHFDLVRNNLTPDLRAELALCLEFNAVHAFLLGLRTGYGLADFIPPRPFPGP